MHFLSTVKLIKRLDKGLITVKDLPFDKLSEAEVARIMRYHGWQYRFLPKSFKTKAVLEAAVLSRYNAVRSVGRGNVTDELACMAIDKYGLKTFLALDDCCKTEVVCLHALRNDSRAYLAIKPAQITDEISKFLRVNLRMKVTIDQSPGGVLQEGYAAAA